MSVKKCLDKRIQNIEIYHSVVAWFQTCLNFIKHLDDEIETLER